MRDWNNLKFYFFKGVEWKFLARLWGIETSFKNDINIYFNWKFLARLWGIETISIYKNF